MKFLLNIVTSWLDKNSPKPIVDTVLDNISVSKYTGYKILKEPHVVFNYNRSLLGWRATALIRSWLLWRRTLLSRRATTNKDLTESQYV